MRLFVMCLCLAASVSWLQAEVKIDAFGELAANAIDQHGDTIGGIGSGLIYDPKEDVFLCVSDRGPADGTLPYRPRYVKLKLSQEGAKLMPKVIESVIFRDEKGVAMTGLIPDDSSSPLPRMKDGRTCIDPEAIALAPDDTIYVTDEYGPFLYQFHRDGTMLRRISLPKEFTPFTAEGKPDFREKAKLISGRGINQGPEGMCLLSDGKTAALIFQSGLIQDGGRHSPKTRLLLINLTTGKAEAMYWYPFALGVEGTGEKLSPTDLSVNDIAALSNTHFLVLERDRIGRNGDLTHPNARYKSVWQVDISQATNLLQPPTGEPKMVEKTLFFNLPNIVPDRDALAAKWEGLALIGPPKDNEVTLIMSADNDFLTPGIKEDGQVYPYNKAKDAIPSQFFKISGSLPEKP